MQVFPAAHPKLAGVKGLIDTHCHLNDSVFDAERAQVIARAKAAGVELIVDVAIDLPSSVRAVKNAQEFRAVAACIGIDPQILVPGEYYEPEYLEESFRVKKMQEVEELLLGNREVVLMLGETGMDDYWLVKLVEQGELSEVARQASLAAQEDLFRRHLELSAKYDLPLSVHSRAAEERCLRIAREFPAARGIFHSFTGSEELAREVLAAGWGLGINAIVTYKSASELRAGYQSIMRDLQIHADSPVSLQQHGLFLETDAPYLIPSNMTTRPENNEPANIIYTLAVLESK